VLWWRSANVTRSSPGLTVMGIQPDGGGQAVGGGTVALGVEVEMVGVDCTSGWGVGVWMMGASTGVSVGVGGISGT
jgi:hypothetical protein